MRLFALIEDDHELHLSPLEGVRIVVVVDDDAADFVEAIDQGDLDEALSEYSTFNRYVGSKDGRVAALVGFRAQDED